MDFQGIFGWFQGFGHTFVPLNQFSLSLSYRETLTTTVFVPLLFAVKLCWKQSKCRSSRFILDLKNKTTSLQGPFCCSSAFDHIAWSSSADDLYPLAKKKNGNLGIYIYTTLKLFSGRLPPSAEDHMISSKAPEQMRWTLNLRKI